MSVMPKHGARDWYEEGVADHYREHGSSYRNPHALIIDRCLEILVSVCVIAGLACLLIDAVETDTRSLDTRDGRAALFVALPSSPDPVGAPANLVWQFRLNSLTGNLLVWALLTLGLGVLWAEAARAAAAARAQNSIPLSAEIPAS